MKHIGIVGGGASGIAAAILAGREGFEVTIFERNDRIGKKLLTTGNGRGNVSNIDLDLRHFHSEDENFPAAALENFNEEMREQFFRSLNISLVEDGRGRLYPISLQVSTLLNMMRLELERLGVHELTETFIKKIEKRGEFFYLEDQEGEEYSCDYLILATGGKSMPRSGSDGKSYPLAQSFGHQLTTLFPGIDALELDFPYLKHIAGTKVQGRIELYHRGEKIQEGFGEILFTREGISGPPVLELAREVNRHQSNLSIKMPLINFTEQHEDLKDELFGRTYTYPDWTVGELIEGVVGKKLTHVLLKENKLDPTLSVSFLDYLVLEKLIRKMFEIEIPVKGTRGWDSAQVTCGGIDTKDVHEKTLESKKVRDLYFTGEVLDVDGDCGGYNLHWAWSSAHAVINSIKNKIDA